VQDWLQAGETDLDFLRRLMGKAHMYYYFVHTGTSHQLVFANLPETPYPPVFASGKLLRYTWTGADELGMVQPDLISQYSYQRTLTSSAVRTVLARQEAAWEADPVAHFQTYRASSKEDVGELPFNAYKIYQYGGSRDEAQVLSDATSCAMQSAAVQFSGASYCPLMRVGHQFGVTGAGTAAAQQPVRPSLEGQRFVLTQVSHEASADGVYRNQFQATEANGFIASFSIQETQQGVILAQVVAKSGSPDTQDWRYYTANYFDPETNALVDRGSGTPDLTAMGVYVRFSTDGPDAEPAWIKLAPHMQTVPEIGVTVLVTRAQDESELPEIQSIIQANGGMTIQPSTWMANTHVGSSYSTNYGDGQSIRFGKSSAADLNRAASIVGTAYATGKYRDTSYSQGANYSFAVSEATAKSSSSPSDLWGPYGGAPDLLNASESFGSSYSRSQAQVNSSSSEVGISYSKSMTGMSENQSVVGMHQSSSAVGIAVTSDVTLSSTSTQAIGSTTSTQLIGSSRGTQITGTSNSLSLTGMSDQLAITGISNGIGITGSQWNLSVTGESTSIGATGMRSSAEVVGASESISITGASSSQSLLGSSNSNSLTGSVTEFSITGSTSRNNIIGMASGTTVHGVSTEESFNLQKMMSEANLTETSVTMSNGVRVTAASGRVNTEMSGPDINMPAIKIIM
jgi:type VI secretion system secreted protein VgrG